MAEEPVMPSAARQALREDYFARLRAYIERYKRYPRRALIRREEGTVLLRFTLDRQGRVLSQEIARSSGHSDLDHEARGILERASPLPEIPAAIGAEQLEIEIPVSFSLS